MIQFLSNYGLFALKLVTVLIALAAVAAVVAAVINANVHHHQSSSEGHLEVTKLNERFDGYQQALKDALMEPEILRALSKKKRAERKAERKARRKQIKKAQREELLSVDTRGRERVYVLDFRGDIQASSVSSLRREITAVLSVAEKEDEVVVRVESGGGLVHSYGLAASQLQRVTQANIPLTVCVDKVAASGGYMMACVANKLIAAPFAVIGSIGVVAQLPNFHRLLKKHDIDFELMTAGKHKRTLTVFGKNTDEGRRKFAEDLEDTHALFKEFVGQHRPAVDLEETATGEIWFGRRALSKHLVDEVLTSDEYLDQTCRRADVFEVKFQPKKSLQERLATSVEQSLERVAWRLWERGTRRLS